MKDVEQPMRRGLEFIYVPLDFVVPTMRPFSRRPLAEELEPMAKIGLIVDRETEDVLPWRRVPVALGVVL